MKYVIFAFIATFVFAVDGNTGKASGVKVDMLKNQAYDEMLEKTAIRKAEFKEVKAPFVKTSEKEMLSVQGGNND